MPAQLQQHGRVGIGGGDGDAVPGEYAGGLSGARADLESRANRATRVREHLANRSSGYPGRNLSYAAATAPKLRARAGTHADHVIAESIASHRYLVDRRAGWRRYDAPIGRGTSGRATPVGSEAATTCRRR